MRVFSRTFPGRTGLVVNKQINGNYEMASINYDTQEINLISDDLDANEFQYLGESLIELSRKLRK